MSPEKFSSTIDTDEAKGFISVYGSTEETQEVFIGNKIIENEGESIDTLAPTLYI